MYVNFHNMHIHIYALFHTITCHITEFGSLHRIKKESITYTTRHTANMAELFLDQLLFLTALPLLKELVYYKMVIEKQRKPADV